MVSLDIPQRGNHMFYYEVTGFGDEGRAVGIISALARLLTLSHNIILDNQMGYRLGKWTVR